LTRLFSLLFREKSFTDIIINLAQMIDINGSKNVINVDRNNILDGGLRGFARKVFDAKRLLFVRFADEQGIDAGGLTKELLRLLLQAIRSELPIFSGPENARNLLLDYKGEVCFFHKLLQFRIKSSSVPSVCSVATIGPNKRLPLLSVLY